jgi:DNA-binding NarL/FixJ family response regulator
VRSAHSPAKQPVRVLLLEGSGADAEIIAHELRHISMPTVIERVDSRTAFIAALDNFSPDVVLCDHSLAQLDSHSALKLVRETRPATPFIIVTGPLIGALTGTAIRAGAEAVVSKTNLGVIGPSISNALAVRAPLQSLSRRQLEVLRMIAEGHRTREIAGRLGLGVKTVESHRYALMKRLRAGSVVSLVRYAIRVGLVPLEQVSEEKVG